MSDAELTEDTQDGASTSEAIVQLFSDTEHVGIRRFEEDGPAELITRLTPVVGKLLERACTILHTLLTRYESEEDSPLDGMLARADGIPDLEIVPLRAISAPIVRPPGAVIGDLAFIAIAELRQHQHRLSLHRPTLDAQDIISDCGSALRAIRKSIYALEPLLCELEGTPRLLPPRLETSLQVRRQYHKLWSFAAAAGTVDPATARAALRGAGTRIAMLTGCPVYPQLREDDRFRIRELQSRILLWLREGDDELVATRLWQDFALFVEMLRQVNLREELIQHDRERVRAALSKLLGRGESALDEVRKDLVAVTGLDDALDELMASGPSAQALLRELTRVRSQLQDSMASDRISPSMVAL